MLNWRLDQLELTRPSRLGRDGLKVGRKAPDFTLPCAAGGGEVSLHDFAGRRLLLVFTQAGCGPCQDIVPELNRLQAKGDLQVLVVNNGEPAETRDWAAEIESRFPVLVQEKFSLSKKYEVFATPFAFLIDEQGVVTSTGIVGSASTWATSSPALVIAIGITTTNRSAIRRSSARLKIHQQQRN